MHGFNNRVQRGGGGRGFFTRSGGGRGQGGRGQGGGRNKPRPDLTNCVRLRISGFARDVAWHELQRFLNESCKRAVRWESFKYGYPETFVFFNHMNDAQVYLDLNGRFMDGKKITVQDCKQMLGKQLTDVQRQELFGIVATRYDGNAKVLRLDKMKSKEHKWLTFANPQLTLEIFNLISANCADVESLQFSGNNISSLDAFKTMFQHAPKVVNLSFENNRLQEFSQLDRLKDYKGSLKNIVLMDNPMVLDCSNPKIYHHEVKSRFPCLETLDGAATSPIIMFDIPSKIQAPPPVPARKGNCFDSEQTRSLVIPFLEKYLAVYDQRSDDLMTFYHSNARFSLTTTHKHISTVDDKKVMKSYNAMSRNLLERTKKHRRAECIKTGKVKISMHLKKLPASVHKPEMLTLDATMVPSTPQTLLLSFQGYFLEQGVGDTAVGRRFHRSMVLGPSTGALPVVILSDQLNIGPAVPEKDIPRPTPPAVHNVPPSGAVAERQQSVIKLAAATGVATDIATQALERHNWNYAASGQAIVNWLQGQNKS